MMGMSPYRLTICGLDELAQYADAGVSHVVSILDPGWPEPGEFKNFAPHNRIGWRFHDTINVRDDGEHPSAAIVAALIEHGRRLAAQPVAHLLVHCHMGISRSTAAAAILMSLHVPGREAEAFAKIRAIRPRSWPNSRMIALADVLLGCDGRLFTAMQDHHRAVAIAFPDLAKILRTGERAHEVPDDA